MDEAPKDIVKHAYDHIADWYLSWVKDQTSPRERYAQKVLKNARATTTNNPLRIVDLGCGPGVPTMRMLLDQGAHVVGNDISAVLLSMAKEQCSEATLIPGDMADLTFEPASFDGAVSFFTLFHLPRTEQKPMLAKIWTWLRPGSLFAFNLATMDEEEIHGEMLGHGMFWSSFPVEESKAMVEEAGFELVEAELLEAGDGKLEEDDADYGVKFLWITARKGDSKPQGDSSA